LLATVAQIDAPATATEQTGLLGADGIRREVGSSSNLELRIEPWYRPCVVATHHAPADVTTME
jgi:hypothetical protein